MCRLPIDLRRAACPHAAAQQTQRFSLFRPASTSAERVAELDAETMRRKGMCLSGALHRVLQIAATGGRTGCAMTEGARAAAQAGGGPPYTQLDRCRVGRTETSAPTGYAGGFAVLSPYFRTSPFLFSFVNIPNCPATGQSPHIPLSLGVLPHKDPPHKNAPLQASLPNFPQDRDPGHR